jgi:hypothetical protein
VSVGMSLVFNVSIRLDGIASIYAGPNDPQIAASSVYACLDEETATKEVTARKTRLGGAAHFP